jgi:threonine/homoserine/homoserine lactone efflux protein
MDTFLLLILGGMVIGVLVAAPIGPVNMICIRRSLAYGPLNGFFSGLGAALGDGVFAIVTAFGLTAIAQLIEGYATPIKLAGGIMLVSFGIHNFRAEVNEARLACAQTMEDEGASTLAGAIASTFALTITNPATLFGFAALFAGLGTLAGGEHKFLDAAVTVAGVVCGSAAWWFTITTITGVYHRQINAKVMRVINRGSGVFVFLFGLVVLGDLVYDFVR